MADEQPPDPGITPARAAPSEREQEQLQSGERSPAGGTYGDIRKKPEAPDDSVAGEEDPGAGADELKTTDTPPSRPESATGTPGR